MCRMMHVQSLKERAVSHFRFLSPSSPVVKRIMQHCFALKLQKYLWITNLHLTFLQHEGEQIMMEFIFILADLIL